jgi:4'-phosphopantetheinyl transferase EntD
MSDLLPAAVVVRESADPSAWRASDWPEEQAAMARAADRRRRQHGAVRELARGALAELGIAPGPILTGERREPRWPPGVVGSLTHCRVYCAAAVALDRDVLTVGIDAEPDDPLGPGLVRRLCAPAELDALEALGEVGLRAKALFSIKEAVYKAWYPVTHRWLGFHDVEVVAAASPDGAGSFETRVLVEAPPELAVISGRFERADGLVRAAAFVSRDRR